MPLGIKVILILGMTATLALIAQIAVIGNSILPAFDAVESAAAREQLERVVVGLQAEVEAVDDLAADWAAWSDSYRFLKAPEDDYPHADLVYGSLASGNFDLFGFYSPQGELLWGAVSDRSIAGMSGLVDRLTALLRSELPLSIRSLPNAEAGLLANEIAPLIVSAHPVTPSPTGDQPLGKLVVARFLEGGLLERIARHSGVEFEFDDAPDLLAGLAKEPAGEVLEAETGAVLSLRRDLFGDPHLALRVRAPQGLMDDGRTRLREAVGAFLIISFVVFILTLACLQITLLRPLTLLAKRIVEIGFEADWRGRLNERRGDVIGIIGREFDELLDRMSILASATERKSEGTRPTFRPVSPKQGDDED